MHEVSFLRGFVDYIAELATQSLTGAAQQRGVRRPRDEDMYQPRAYQHEEPPTKRQATPSSSLVYEDKASLVEKVKTLQRRNPQAKEAWWAWCDTYGQGNRDPSRHDERALQKFLDKWG